MKLQLDGKSWKIRRAPSIFTNRNGCEDVHISVESDHGAKDDEDRKYYEGMTVLAAESGVVLRKYRATHKDITLDFLLENGFIDKLPECH